MDVSKITIHWLKRQNFKLQNIYKPPNIKDVILKELKVVLDGRGGIIELWNEPWVKGEKFLYPKHNYQTTTDFGVVKGWHLHKEHTDQLAITRGKVQVVLLDLRSCSPSYLSVNSIFIGIGRPGLLKIPPGVMHGWKALTSPEVIIVNFQTHIYDPSDEFKFPWDSVLKGIWEPKNG